MEEALGGGGGGGGVGSGREGGVGVGGHTYLQYDQVSIDEIKDGCLYIGPVDGTVEGREVWWLTSQ